MYMQSIGADPELFVAKKGRVSSAIGYLGGSKDAPRMLNGYGVQEDNVLAEYSMPPVMLMKHVNPKRQFRSNILEGIATVQAALKYANLSTVNISSHSYSPKTLKKYGPAALEFGCDPDYNAYTARVNPSPNRASTLRTAGGHVHVGYSQGRGNTSVACMVAKSMDLFLGVPSVLLDPDNRRRELYGKAGAYRMKEYGIEYRTLSNFWIHNNDTIDWVYTQTANAIAHAPTINLLISAVGEQAIQDCINTGNQDLAAWIVRKFNINLPEVRHAQAA